MSQSNKMMQGMILSAIGAFVFVFLFEFLVHGFLMKDMYDATISVWRPQAESSMPVMFLSQFLFALAVAFFYPIVGPDINCKKAMPFGFGLGLVMAMPAIGTFCYLPIPITISLCWAAAAFFKSLGTALIVAKIFNRWSC
jgi:hypothetical protein